jgi:hypothetical protein
MAKMQVGIDTQAWKTTQLAQHAASLKLAEQLATMIPAVTLPKLTGFSDSMAKMQVGSALAKGRANCDFGESAAPDGRTNNLTSTASWRGRRLFQCYFVIYVSVVLLQCEFDTSPLELIAKDLAGALGIGGLTAWHLAGAIYDRLFGRPE